MYKLLTVLFWISVIHSVFTFIINMNNQSKIGNDGIGGLIGGIIAAYVVPYIIFFIRKKINP